MHPEAMVVKKNEIRKSSGGFSTELHAFVNSLRKTHHLEVAPGQAHDIFRAHALVSRARGWEMVAKKAYRPKAIYKQIKEKGMRLIMPLSPIAEKPYRYLNALYKTKIKVEHFFHDL